MKKRKSGRTLSRTSDQRLALKRTMLTSLILHKKITTTLAKAKELRPFAERMVTKAKKTAVSPKEQAILRMLQKDLTNKVAAELISIAEKLSARNGGYTRIIKLVPRKSDGAEMAVIEWVGLEQGKKEEAKAKVAKREAKSPSVSSSVKATEDKSEDKTHSAKAAEDKAPSTKATEDKQDKKQE